MLLLSNVSELLLYENFTYGKMVLYKIIRSPATSGDYSSVTVKLQSSLTDGAQRGINLLYYIAQTNNVGNTSLM